MEKKRGSFTGSIGFVLAAAGSAVGLGNIWRFPYLAARDGGGLFLLVYFVLAITFGFTLLTTEVALGRKTKRSPLTAYGVLNKKWKWLGVVASIVPFIIMPYYCVIGGWVLKYFIVFLTGNTVFNDEPYGAVVVFNINPVTDIVALTVNRKFFAVPDVTDHQRQKFFRKLVRTIVIGTV